MFLPRQELFQVVEQELLLPAAVAAVVAVAVAALLLLLPQHHHYRDVGNVVQRWRSENINQNKNQSMKRRRAINQSTEWT